jgi:hypothetical protein
MSTSSTEPPLQQVITDLFKDYKGDETGGKHAIRGFTFQVWHAVLETLLAHKKGEDYAVVLEWQQDVAVLNSSTQPTRVKFVQLKKNESTLHWKLANLIAPEKLKADEHCLRSMGANLPIGSEQLFASTRTPKFHPDRAPGCRVAIRQPCERTCQGRGLASGADAFASTCSPWAAATLGGWSLGFTNHLTKFSKSSVVFVGARSPRRMISPKVLSPQGARPGDARRDCPTLAADETPSERSNPGEDA